MKKLMIFCVFSSAIFSACQDENKEKKDQQAPLISIVTPADTTTFMSGMSMPILVTLSDNEALEEFNLTLTNTTLDSVLMQLHHMISGKNYSVDTSFTFPDFGMHQDYELEVEVYDKNGNSATASVHPHVHQ